MQINAERLWARLAALAEITDKAEPWTRRSFTPRFLEGRAWLEQEFAAAGLAVSRDAGGNLVGHLPGREAARGPIVLGSHSDTVPAGGRFDGTLGVLAGLEVAQSLREQGIVLDHPLEVIDFLAEEPSDFGLSCIGSRALAGALTQDMLAMTRPDGMTLAEGLAYVGGRPDALAEAARPRGAIAAYLEVHIEQGRVLESEGRDIGIVTDIVGIRRERIVVSGRADHAGATPMNLRQDALVGAARIIDAAYRKAFARGTGDKPMVATVGYLVNQPNAANAVPGRVEMILEVRSGDEPAVAAFTQELLAAVAPALAELGVSATSSLISHVPPTPCAEPIRAAIARAADGLGLNHRAMPSGAGHDGMFVSRVGPIGMIFVPCRDGRSHAPEEWIEPEQAATGARALAAAVLELDRALAR